MNNNQKCTSYTLYAVHKGHKPGIYKTWTEVKKQIHKYPGAQYKKYTGKTKQLCIHRATYFMLYGTESTDASCLYNIVFVKNSTSIYAWFSPDDKRNKIIYSPHHSCRDSKHYRNHILRGILYGLKQIIKTSPQCSQWVLYIPDLHCYNIMINYIFLWAQQQWHTTNNRSVDLDIDVLKKIYDRVLVLGNDIEHNDIDVIFKYYRPSRANKICKQALSACEPIN